ncbi:MAG: hypothetical protein OK452_04300 [Thaumarchaeota archaeon]|nr:hypothetical protein [Nitrososphaerota archaeon]
MTELIPIFPEEGHAISKKQGWMRRYQRYVHGVIHNMERTPAYHNAPRIKLYKDARAALKPVLKEYATARLVSWSLFNDERIRAKFLNRDLNGGTAGRRALNDAIREARIRQTALRKELTSLTGIGLSSMQSEDERIRGES